MSGWEFWDYDMAPDQAMSQANKTVNCYMLDAVDRIDDHFGVGYAAANPVLVAAFIQAMAQDYHTTAMVIAAGRARVQANEAAQDAQRAAFVAKYGTDNPSDH